jgi:tocopherol cyclase
MNNTWRPAAYHGHGKTSDFFEGWYFKLVDASERNRLVGCLRFDGVVGWPVTWHAPGIMGWYALVPFMEGYHGVLGFDHEIRGQLVMGDSVVDFSGGRGYIEKDCGQAFPRAWNWMQSNHFAAPGVCLTASVARIPWLGAAFRGFIVGLWLNGKHYRFATYTGAVIEELRLTYTHVYWRLKGPGPDGRPHRLEIAAHRSDEGVDLLQARSTARRWCSVSWKA